MNKLTSSFLLLFMGAFNVNGNWEMIFHDNFNSSTIDENKWERIENCDHLDELNCYRDTKTNLRLIDGTLAITAIKEKYLTKEFTSGYVRTRNKFTYGKFEVRAALPIGNLLSPYIALTPSESDNQFSEIFIVSNSQDTSVRNEVIHANRSGVTYRNHRLNKNTKLNEFNIYELEWTRTELIWRLNGEPTFYYNLTQRAHPFDKPFKLDLYSSVGGRGFIKKIRYKLTIEEVLDWDCSLLIIDYVRVYRWNSTAPKETDYPENNNSSISKICRPIMDLIRPEIIASTNNLILIAVISMLSFLLFIVFIPLVIYLFARMRRIDENIKRSLGQQECDINEQGLEDKHEYNVPNYDINQNKFQFEVNYLQITNTTKFE